MKRATGPKGKADDLFRDLIRSRGYCLRCGRSDRILQCAHIVSRRYSNTRTDERNAWCLCAYCHMWLTEHPFEHVVFAHETIGEEMYAELRALSLSDRKWKRADWEAECVRLRGLLEAA